MTRILVTGANGAVANQCAICLKEAGAWILGTEASPAALCLYEEDSPFDKMKLIPDCSDAGYLRSLNQVCAEENIELVVVTNEFELEYLAQNCSQLKASMVIPDIKIIRICRSKWKTCQSLPREFVPPTFQIDSPQELPHLFEVLGEEIWVRADFGQAAQTALLCRDIATAQSWLDLKKGWGTYLAAEVLTGKNLAWTSLWWEGELIASSVHERCIYMNPLASQSGITGVASALRTIYHPECCDVCEEAITFFSKTTGKELHGIFCVDLKEDKKGAPKITEINPRPTNTLHLARAGFNVAGALLAKFRGEKISLPKRHAARPDLYFLRAVDKLPVFIDKKEMDKALSHISHSF